MKKRHYKKAIVLDNCVLLRELQVKIPEEFLCLEDKIKNEFWCIEQFFSKFLQIGDFIKDLTVIFHLKTLMTKVGDFDCCSSRTEKPVINIYGAVEKFEYGSSDATLAHEFAHFVDWKLGKLSGFGNISERKGSIENELAKKLLSYQEVKPTGSPFGGSSTIELSSPPELFARYLEQYYKYCFKKYEEPKRPVKNCLYVRREDFEQGLIGPVSKYLNFFQSPFQDEEAVIFEGNLYSADKKVLLKYQNPDNSSAFVVPDFVEIIGNHAFAECKTLVSVTIGSGVKEIGSFAFHHCESLIRICGGQNVKMISQSAFSWCSSLKEIKGFNNLEIVSSMAFGGCSSLTSLESFYNLKYIGMMCFAKCKFLELESFAETGSGL